MAASHTHDGPPMYPEKFWQLQFGGYEVDSRLYYGPGLSAFLAEQAGKTGKELK